MAKYYFASLRACYVAHWSVILSSVIVNFYCSMHIHFYGIHVSRWEAFHSSMSLDEMLCSTSNWNKKSFRGNGILIELYGSMLNI